MITHHAVQPAVGPAIRGIVLAILCLLPLGCSKGNSQAKPSQPAAYVTVATVEVRDVPVELASFGTVEAFNTISVKNQIGGILTGVHFKEGELVEANAPLFTIDPRPYEAALERAQSTLDRDQVQLGSASREAKRYADLLQRGAATEEEYDRAKATADALAASVRGDQAAMVSARLDLDYCRIRSPVKGIAGKILIDRGNVVKSYDLALVTINQVQPINVTFTVPQQHLAELRRYHAQRPLEVEATIPGDSDPQRGTLTFIDNAVDVATGTIRLRATFANEDMHLWPGQYVDVTVRLTTQKDAVLVPTQAIQTGQDGPFVFVLDANSVASMHRVKAGSTVGDQTVVTDGLAAGQTIVTDGQLRLAPGVKAIVKSAATQPATQGAAGAARGGGA